MASEYRMVLPDEKELASRLSGHRPGCRIRKKTAITPQKMFGTKKSVKTKHLSGSRKGATKGPKGQ